MYDIRALKFRFMDKVYEDSLKIHLDNHGKLEVNSKVPLNTREELSIAYTPGVGRVCLAISENQALSKEYTIKHNTVAVITDGSSVLGFGNLGPHAAIPVVEGKAALFKRFANIDAFPICLDTQDTEEIIDTIRNIAPIFGGINLEDISAPRCFEIEQRLRKELRIPIMHDDQHGTAVVVLAGLINALKVARLEKETVKIVINGVGAAGIATTRLLLKYGFKNIILCDTQGAIYQGRPDLTLVKEELSHITNLEKIKGSLAQCLEGANIFIGVSKGGLLTAEMIKGMAASPIIFALANPVPEIMPDIAKAAGAAIVATGRSDFPNQLNNVLAFPGIFRGALDNGVVELDDVMFTKAAEALAAIVKDPSPENILPSIFNEEVTPAVASAIKI